MSAPYVSKGESIILTTHRVSYTGVPYDMILTTRRLILVDSGDTRSDPLIIPLFIIQTVTAGDDVTDEPVLTISLTGTGSSGHLQPMNLIFSLQPGEQRKRERNEWIKKLKKHTASARRQTVHPQIFADPEKGIQLPAATRLPNPPETLTEKDPPAEAKEKTGPQEKGSQVTPVAKSPAVPEKQTGSPDTATPAADKAERPPAKKTPLPGPGAPPATPPPRFRRHTVFAVTAIIIFILGMAVGAFLYAPNVPGKNNDSHAPAVIPDATTGQTPSPPAVIIPKDGVWVRVEYNGSFVGFVGNPGSLLHVGGSGEQVYKISKSDGYVEVSFQKQDYSGRTLAVEVYHDGTMTYRRTVRSPMGEIAFIIDPLTTNPPGVAPAVTK